VSNKIGQVGMRIFLMASMLATSLLLSACGESTEEAYNRGYEDGETDVCNEIDGFNRSMFETLQRKRIC
jgi:major membrane immunogen (membrane-anchored lipoprotein)